MRCGDVPPRTEVLVPRTGARVHLYASCGHGTGAPIPAELCNPDAKVCSYCEKKWRERGGGRESLIDMLADPDFGPVDLGLLDTGERL